jgi:hypothetical protein
MKAIFNKIEFKKEVETKFGTMYQFQVNYGDKVGSFLSKKREQTTFVQGVENEFTETEREYNGVTYYNLKAIKQMGSNNFSRQLKKEQSKYSGFAMSYAKDLVVSGNITTEQMFPTAEKMMKWMVEQDKALENG